jgi:hypothetical protein
MDGVAVRTIAAFLVEQQTLLFAHFAGGGVVHCVSFPDDKYLRRVFDTTIIRACYLGGGVNFRSSMAVGHRAC